MAEEYGRCEGCTRPMSSTAARLGKLLHITELQPDPECPGREYIFAVEIAHPGAKEKGVRIVGGAICHRLVTHDMRRSSYQIAKHIGERGNEAILDLEAHWEQASPEDRAETPKFPPGRE